MTAEVIFVLNSGSSSLKFGLFEPAGKNEVRSIARGAADGIGSGSGKVLLQSGEGKTLYEKAEGVEDQQRALEVLTEQLRAHRFSAPSAVGHRVVHGGPSLTEHQKITPRVLEQLEGAAHFAPLHVPVALTLIRESQRMFPSIGQFACFDTAFHRTLAETAARFPVPEKFWEAGIRRYGFHGLSCESILHALAGKVPARLIIAHLGNGASVTAVRDGRSIDTTMGLTPIGGIIMGTRPGDLDPGLLIHILRMSEGDASTRIHELEKMLDKQSGLLGISGFASDMRQLREAAESSAGEGGRDRGDSEVSSDRAQRSRMALEMFCRAAKKAIAGQVAVLGGLDLLVFTGGIGEHDASARLEICEGLQSFGVSINRVLNTGEATDIADQQSLARVKVLPSDEESQIARHVAKLMSSGSKN